MLYKIFMLSMLLNIVHLCLPRLVEPSLQEAQEMKKAKVTFQKLINKKIVILTEVAQQLINISKDIKDKTFPVSDYDVMEDILEYICGLNLNSKINELKLISSRMY